MTEPLGSHTREDAFLLPLLTAPSELSLFKPTGESLFCRIEAIAAPHTEGRVESHISFTLQTENNKLLLFSQSLFLAISRMFAHLCCLETLHFRTHLVSSSAKIFRFLKHVSRSRRLPATNMAAKLVSSTSTKRVCVAVFNSVLGGFYHCVLLRSL